MSRFDRLRNWPEKLERMTVAELRSERQYWETRARLPVGTVLQKALLQRIREVEKVIARRFPDGVP